jgi:general secretion pathway protein I
MRDERRREHPTGRLLIPRSARGFTLVEVVVAFAVLAITFGALYEVLGSSLHRASEVERYERAVMSAQSLLAEFSATARPEEGAVSGKTSDGMAWERQIEPYDVGRPLQSALKPFLVTVVVHWGTRESQSLQLQAILLGRSEIP